MQSFERELHTLRPVLGDPATDILIARERREVFSVRPELRLIAWGGAMLLATAGGIVLKNNLDRIGPLALTLMIGLVAAACYGWTWWHRGRAGVADEYVLLLGALLVSADAAFVETQFKLFGNAWHRHFLILAFVHGLAAYLYRSRTLLSLAIAALTGWLGIRGLDGVPGEDAFDYSLRAFASAGAVLLWRQLNRRDDFLPVFDHFGSLLALAGGLALTVDDDGRVIGCLLTLGIAAAVIRLGFRTGRVSFVLYAFLAAVIAVDVILVDRLEDDALILLVLVISTIGAIAALFRIYARFREVRA